MSMCFAAGLNVAVTRTPFSSPMILAILSGQPNVSAPALCAALASLFVTRSSKFIGPQRDRSDLRHIDDLQPVEKTMENGKQDKDSTVVDINRNKTINSPAVAEASSLLAEAGPTGEYSAVIEV